MTSNSVLKTNTLITDYKILITVFFNMVNRKEREREREKKKGEMRDFVIVIYFFGRYFEVNVGH